MLGFNVGITVGAADVLTEKNLGSIRDELGSNVVVITRATEVLGRDVLGRKVRYLLGRTELIM